jgi:glycosyltransferase involved in cell wall biosynthesis
MTHSVGVERSPFIVSSAQRAEPGPRVMAVIPGDPEAAHFIFAKRQVLALREMGVTVRSFYIGSRQHPIIVLREWRRFLKELREFQPDLVHAHFGTMTAFMCAVGTTVPLLVTYRGSDLNPVPSISQLRRRAGQLMSQLAALRAKRVICVSEELRERLWMRAGHASVIPNGVDITEFFPRPRAACRAELGWRDDEHVVLFNAGRHPRIKRLDLAEAAVGVARALSGELRFVVLDGHQDPRQVPTLMNAADCLVVTSDFEGSPDIVKEAMACNLPVVSVDVGDVRDRLAAVRPSCIVARSPDALGRAITDLLMHPQRSNGHAVVRAELTMEKIAERVLAEYRAALGPEWSDFFRGVARP